MADVLNRTTKELKLSVNTPDYPESDWIISPDLSGVQNVPAKYWKIVGDTVSEMSQVEKDAVDAMVVASIPIGGTQMVTFANNRIGSDQYLNIGALSSSAVGFLFPTNGVVKHISAQWANGTSNFSINLRKNSTATNLYTVNAIGSSKRAIVSNINVSCSAEDIMQMYVSGINSNINNLVVMVWLEMLGN